jgi:hypothetical protein
MSHISQSPQAGIFGSIVRSPSHIHDRELGRMNRERDDLVAWMMGQSEFLRRCREGEIDLRRERALTSAEHNREGYEHRRRRDPDYYTKASRQRRALARLNTKGKVTA